MALRKMRAWGPKGQRGEVKACLGKTRWNSEDAAQRTLTRLRRENPDAFDSTVRPYRCRASGKGHWHVGHGQ